MLGGARRSVNSPTARGRVRAVMRAARDRWGTRTLVWAALLALFATVLDFVPLFDVLGYDFSFALGLATALAAVDVGQGTVVRWWGAHPDRSKWDAPSVAMMFVSATAKAVGVLLPVPLALALANMVRVRNCDVSVGLAFFALLPVSTAIYGAAAGVIAGLVGPRAAPRRSRLLAFAFPIVSIVWTLLRLYRDPPVFAYDPFGGYFPGPIYDEALRPPVALVLFRLANLVWLGAAVLLAVATVGRGRNPARWRRPALLAALPVILGAIAFYALGARLGFRIDAGDLRDVLERTYVTEHFVVHYAGAANKTRADLALEGEDLEFRYAQLRQTLGVEPKLPLTVWEFPNADTKKQLVGAGGTLYAKPWTREIFVQWERFPARHLRHEMAHVFAGAFGDPVFGVALAWRFHGPLPLPTLASGLVEGIAEAADASDPDGDATIHEQAAAMIADGLAPPLAAVVGAGFSTLAGARAYTIAGSFCTFLLSTRGAEKLRALYRSAGDFPKVYAASLTDLEREWRQFLATLPVTPRERAQASEDFRRPAIFSRVCARELAARVSEARAVEHADPARAVALLEWTCRDDPNEPTYRLALAEALALTPAPGRALATLRQLEDEQTLTSPLRARAAALAGDVAFHAGDLKLAAAEEERARDWAATEADRRQALAKLEALRDERTRSSLGRALFGDAFGEGADPVQTFFLLSEYARLFPADPLGPYLIGRQLVARDPRHALAALSRACGDPAPTPGPHPLPPEFVRECLRMTAEAGYRAGAFPQARTALERLSTGAITEADRLRALDMRARVDWAAGRRASPSDQANPLGEGR